MLVPVWPPDVVTSGWAKPGAWGLCFSPTCPVPQVRVLFKSMGCTVHPVYILWRMEVWVQERKGRGCLYHGVSTPRERGDGWKGSVTSPTCQVDFFFLPSSHALQLGAPLPVNNFIWPCCRWGPLIKLSHPFCLWQLLTIWGQQPSLNLRGAD